METFPTPTYTNLYLDSSGKLSSSLPSQQSFNAFVYDPDLPVPTKGGNNLILQVMVRHWWLWVVQQRCSRHDC